MYSKLIAWLGKINLNTIAPLSAVILTIIITALVFKFSGSALGSTLQGDIEAFLTAARGTVWAPFAVIVVFTALGLTGFPQFLLIGMAVMIFGPAAGFVFSWIATMVSSSVGFTLGRVFGADLLKRRGGTTANDIAARISRHGLISSMLVRVIPSAPFVVVNMVAGVSRIPFWKFAVGTGLGIVPKGAIIAFLGASLTEFLTTRDPKDLLILIVVFLAWIGIGYWVKRRFGSPAKTAAAKTEQASLPDQGASMATPKLSETGEGDAPSRLNPAP